MAGARLAPDRRMKEYSERALALLVPASSPISVMTVGIARDMDEINIIEKTMRPRVEWNMSMDKRPITPRTRPKDNVRSSPAFSINFPVKSDTEAPARPATRIMYNSDPGPVKNLPSAS